MAEKMDMETELEHLKKRKAELSRIENDLTDISSWFEKNDNNMSSCMAGCIRDLGDAIGEVSSAAWEVEDAIEELMEEIKDLEEAKTIESEEDSNGSDD